MTPRSRPVFRALARAFVPEAARLDEAGWASLEAIVERAVGARSPRLQRQLGFFLRSLDLLARLRFLKGLARLDPARTSRLVANLAVSRVLLLRRGVWGLRTLVFLGYYGDMTRAAAIGYRADPAGWEARR